MRTNRAELLRDMNGYKDGISPLEHSNRQKKNGLNERCDLAFKELHGNQVGGSEENSGGCNDDIGGHIADSNCL